MEQLNLSTWTGKVDGTTSLSAAEWNAAMTAIQNKVNEIINGGVSAVSDFYVNGVKQAPVNGVVTLASKGKYVCNGTLIGKLVIGASSDTFSSTADEPTQLYLNGVTINNTLSDNCAIEYLPKGEKLYITLCKNKKNILVCSNVAAIADSQKGALHCENNMIVQGNGYLTCINKGGHGIKSSELRITGRPHIYAEASHDGIHGNKRVTIEGGVFYINKANDAFGTRAESGVATDADYKSPGIINIFGGEFYAYNILQNLFDSNDTDGHIFFVQDKVMTVATDTDPSVMNAAMCGLNIHTDLAEDKIFKNVTPITPSAYFGAATVTGATLSGDKYVASGTSVEVSGYLDKAIQFGTQSSELKLNGAYIKVASGPAIEYTKDKKNIKITAAADTLNAIVAEGNDATCVKSLNNIAVEPKNNSVLYISAPNGHGMEGSEISMRDAKGTIIIEKCKGAGLEGSEIKVAETGNPFAGSLISRGNGGKDFSARLSSKNKKGNITILADLFIGCVSVDGMYGVGVSDLGNSNNLFYNKAEGTIFRNDPGKTSEPYAAIPYDNSSSYPIPEM